MDYKMKIKEAIEKGAIELKVKDVESPKLKARMLMQFVLNKPRQYIIVNDMKELTAQEEKRYFAGIQKLRNHIPIEHITHQKEFMKLSFFVNENVLIPRQDTETLVEEVIKIAKTNNAKNILDLCTGSGAIAISLAKYIDESKIIGVDISQEALKVAKKNAISNEVERKVSWIKSDLFQDIKPQKFDIIVSNPPYIKKDIISTLERQVQKEPKIALDGGYDGLDFYRKIIKKSYQYLKYKGYLCLEIGYDQKIDVIELLENEEKYSEIYCKKDAYGNDRVVVARLK